MERLTRRELEALLAAITEYDNDLELNGGGAFGKSARWAAAERAALERVMEKLVRPLLYPPKRVPASWKRSVT